MEGIEHKFVRFPSESVTLCADSLGLHLQGDVTKVIGEDTSFRIRQIVDVSVTVQCANHVRFIYIYSPL